MGEIINQETEHFTGDETYRRHTKELRNRNILPMYHLTEDEMKYFELDNSTRRLQNTTMTSEGQGLKNTSRKSDSRRRETENNGSELNKIEFEICPRDIRSNQRTLGYEFNKASN